MFAESCLCARIPGWSPHWHCMRHQCIGHHLGWHQTEHWVTVWSTVNAFHLELDGPYSSRLCQTHRIPTCSWTQASCGIQTSYSQGQCTWGHPTRSPLTCWSPALKPREEVWAASCELAPLSVNQLLVAPNLGQPPYCLFHPILNMSLPHSPEILCYYFLLQSGPLSSDSSIILSPPKAFKYALRSAIWWSLLLIHLKYLFCRFQDFDADERGRSRCWSCHCGIKATGPPQQGEVGTGSWRPADQPLLMRGLHSDPESMIADPVS